MERLYIGMMPKVCFTPGFGVGWDGTDGMYAGPDDLPAHVKSALIGASVTIPIKDGKLVSCCAAFLVEVCKPG